MLRLRDVRKKAGLTMRELGQVIGVAESTISQYETGKRQPDYETLLKLGEFFSVSTDYLLGVSDSLSKNNHAASSPNTPVVSTNDNVMTDLSIGEKIKTLREKNGLTLEQVGNAVGVGKSTVLKWENGVISNMRKDKIADLAKVLNTTPAYLMGWTDEIQVDNLFRIETRRFPLLGNIACGTPIFASENKELYVEAGSNIEADFCLRAKGDSMIGARIYDGDIVFIKQQEMVDDGEIAAVLIEDEATLKRVQYNPDTNELLLFAENPKYRTMRYVGEELNHIRILGKAVAFQSDIR